MPYETAFDIAFDARAPFEAIGWVFGVPQCFETALDIQSVTRTQKRHDQKVKHSLKARGCPPSYDFQPGDIFYEPRGVGQLTWGEAQNVPGRTIQIISRSSDDMLDLRVIWRAVDPHRSEIIRLTQVQFAFLLRYGVKVSEPDAKEADHLSFGCAAGHISAEQYQGMINEILIQHGADPVQSAA
jgi:hypothetical protein